MDRGSEFEMNLPVCILVNMLERNVRLFLKNFTISRSSQRLIRLDYDKRMEKKEGGSGENYIFQLTSFEKFSVARPTASPMA